MKGSPRKMGDGSQPAHPDVCGARGRAVSDPRRMGCRLVDESGRPRLSTGAARLGASMRPEGFRGRTHHKELGLRLWALLQRRDRVEVRAADLGSVSIV